MEKNILNELNRAREIMGLDLISEEQLNENIGNGNGQNFGLMGAPTAKYKDLTEKEDVEEKDMEEGHKEDHVEEKEEEVKENGKNPPMEGVEEGKVVKEQEEEEEEGEEEEVVDPNAVVTKLKRVLFGQDNINIGAELVYKYNKQKQKPVKGSAVVRWADFGDLISSSDERKPVKDWKYDYSKDRQMYDTLANEYPKKYKSGISTILKKIVARRAEELGVDVGDVNQLFASFSEFDPSRYKVRTSERAGSSKRSDGEKGSYIGYRLNKSKRENEQDAPDKFSNFVLTYMPKDGDRQTVYFYKNGNVEGSSSRWEQMVQGIVDRNEKYEFCQALPDALKNSKNWSKTSSNVRGNYNRSNSIKC